ncbi:NAD(P)H-binding protein [Asanoa sp. WMMD1127]|uniref:NAD(P)-dependent oxidoreductase n=1 Tax=Asanoa sp. WMMD1127 TaxID=3016107 RepID=UPI0024165573|nr:NAD(P)H-binding protein [Asanoa sp. WMMD1127]MDG4826567.1 NAD(P)H-binding protein [Asanoa sp. WMMD1127]
MPHIIVFGAGGRAGRRIVAEARRRRHAVTAVVRDPARHPDLDATAGDVTDPARVATLAKGHDAAVNAAAGFDAGFFPAAAHALIAADVPRLVAIGIGTTLEVAPGVPIHDTPDFPAEHRAFSLGHAAQIDVLRGADLDWVLLVPPPTLLDDTTDGTGHYTTGATTVLPTRQTLFPYADLARAVVDEIDHPRHHRAVVAVGP